MATRTFTTAGVNNLWSNAANWDTGVPLNTDTAVIPVEQDCEFDVDQSGFAAGITVTLNGTLHASTTAGSYVLKLAAAMTGSGTLRAGTSGTPYPTTCTFTINRNGFTITATSLTLDLNCSEPTTKYILLSGVEAVGQTVLSVDTDVTGESAYWADGATIRIDDVNRGSDSEERVIAAGGVTASTITITAGLTNQKEIGAKLILVSRNVKITHTALTGAGITGGTGGRIYTEIRNANSGIAQGTSHTIGGTISSCAEGILSGTTHILNGIISGCSIGFNGGTSHTVNSGALISGCSNGGILNSAVGFSVAGTLSGCGMAISASSGFTFTGTITGCSSGLNTTTGFYVAGTVTNCTNGVITSAGHIFAGAITNCTSGINAGSGFVMAGATFSGNTQDINGTGSFTAQNASFASATEFASYNGAARNITAFAESIDHDQVAGAYKAWTRGGIVTKTAALFPTGYTYSYQHACESASYYCFQNFSVTVPAGGGLVVQCYVRKDALMAYLPRVWILLPGIEPFISGVPSYESIMTDSVDTWETLVLVYGNATTAPVTVTVRTVAKNAANNVYTYPINTVLAPASYDVYNTLLGYVDDLETRLTAGRAANLDNLDATISSRATAAAIAALNNLSAAQVNAEIVDALTIDTYAEPAAVPIATSSLKDKLGWLFALARNRLTQTANLQTLRNDANNADIATAQVSDDGLTATRDEWL